VPDNIKENLEIRPVKWIDEVLAIALERLPEPLDDDAYLASSEGMGQGDEAGQEAKDVDRPRSH
jgi:ATP-dependent Lon protease